VFREHWGCLNSKIFYAKTVCFNKATECCLSSRSWLWWILVVPRLQHTKFKDNQSFPTGWSPGFLLQSPLRWFCLSVTLPAPTNRSALSPSSNISEVLLLLHEKVIQLQLSLRALANLHFQSKVWQTNRARSQEATAVEWRGPAGTSLGLERNRARIPPHTSRKPYGSLTTKFCSKPSQAASEAAWKAATDGNASSWQLPRK